MRIPKGQIYGMHKAISTNTFMAQSAFIVKFKMFKMKNSTQEVKGYQKVKKNGKENKEGRDNKCKSKTKQLVY